METTTFKCEKCGWVGNPPLCQRVSSGHSFWPTRDICPDCFKNGRGSFTVKLHVLYPKPEFYQIAERKKLFYLSETLVLLNFSREMSSFLLTHCGLNFKKVQPVIINDKQECFVISKYELDDLVNKIKVEALR